MKLKECMGCGKKIDYRIKSGFCRKCYHRNYWESHPELKRSRTGRNLKYYLLNKNFVINYKKNECCVLCGWKKHPEILQFHHKEKENKRHSIANALTHLSLNNLKKEIKKCILLCPNCHYWLHYKESSRKREV